jgi:hypothetical protein
MNEVKELTTEEKLLTQNLRIALLLAQQKLNEYKTICEQQAQKMLNELQGHDAALVKHLTAIAKAAELDVEKLVFNWDRLAFEPKPEAPKA